MMIADSLRRRTTTWTLIVVAMSVLPGLLSSNTAVASAQGLKIKNHPEISTPTAPAAKQPGSAHDYEAWHKALLQLPRQSSGCYTATYPRVEWVPIACSKPSPYPMAVGGRMANDYVAHASQPIHSAEGSFTSVSGGITETGLINNTGSPVADTYTLQLNTNLFITPLCAGSPTSSTCRGWQQFVYENRSTTNDAYIEYWLIGYGVQPFFPNCPDTTWTKYFESTSTAVFDCYKKSPSVVLGAGAQSVANLGNIKVSGAVATGGDTIMVTIGGTPYSFTNNAAAGSPAGTAANLWTDAEFNVFGDGSGGQAIFGANTTLGVRLTIDDGTLQAPTCQLNSYTLETNNLTVSGPAPSITPTTLAHLEFIETNGTTATPACATALGTGDTHLYTFGGLYYDFQASGDFVLARTEKDFEVQARQVSGAPSWPDASINRAVATRMGETRVAVCTAPSRLMVDGTAINVVDGQTLTLPGGVNIKHFGNRYQVTDRNGDSMDAEDNGTHINVSVGLGHWPAEVHGVLANAKGSAEQIESRTGKVLTAPFAVADLYGEYADSWRVPARDSLLSVCGGEAPTGKPHRPFYAENLKPNVYKRARAACLAAGVKMKEKDLLDACTLDVAVIGRKDAANVFVHLRTPVAVGRVIETRGKKRPDREHKNTHRP